jgi:hypothetical protein
MKSIKSKLLLLCILTLLLGTAHMALGITTTSPPYYDNCNNAKNVGDVTNLAFDTTYATFDGPGHYIHSPNIWYCYTAPCNGCTTVSLIGSSFDTKLAIYNGCSCPPEITDLMKVNDDFYIQQAQTTFPVTAGNKYLIEVGGFDSEDIGPGVINISCDPETTSPYNNNCYNAQLIGNVENLPFDTTCATFDGPGHCVNSPNIWYRYIATVTGNITVSLCGSDFDTKLAIYQTSSCYPSAEQQIGCNDDYCGLQSEITFEAVAGLEYLIEIGGYNISEGGQGVISISSEIVSNVPANDNCYNAQAVGDVTDLLFDTTNATFDGPGQCMESPNIWYCYTAITTGNVTVSLCGSEFDTMLAVYNGCSCPPSTSSLIEYNDDACNWQSEITFPGTAGNSYLIEVGGYGSQTGEGVLNITSEGGSGDGAPVNDGCRNAIHVGDVTNLPFDTTEATFDGVGHCVRSPNIWYCYTATCTGNVTVSLCGSEFDTMLAVYEGCVCPPTLASMIECNDDFCGEQSQITFPATAGSQFMIEIASYTTGYSTEPGKGVLTISCDGGGAAKAEDLGDAPDSTNNYGVIMTAYPMGGSLGVRANYPTVYDDGGFGPKGPIHQDPTAVAYLGEGVTHEDEADIGSDQDGINNINPLTNNPNQDYSDDGVIFPISMPQCDWTTFDYEVTVVDPDVDLWVNVWCDFNRDGDWDDIIESSCSSIPEWAVQNQLLYDLPVGLNQLTTPAFRSYHPKSSYEQIWMRITLSEQPWKGGENPGVLGNGGSGPSAGYEVGETEDLYFTPDTTSTLCQDFNGDGVVDMDDLTDYVNEWLANCQ